MHLNDRLAVALSLHKTFHEALGRGDRRTLQNICCDGLMQQSSIRMQRRIKLRANNEKWTLKSYRGVQYPHWLQYWPTSVLLPKAHARVMSDRYSALPFPNSSVRQVVVRISSVQEYTLANAAASTTRNHTDYVVIQKMTTKGEEGEWKIWGLVHPTSPEEIEELVSGKGAGADAEETLTERVTNKLRGLY
jgi:hypothetical protein